MPFSKFTMIDEERALEIIDQMRISIPEEIEKAARVLAQRDRILAQANEEAARIVQQAREQSTQLIDREQMVQAAQQRANSIIEEARLEAESIVAEADNYALRSLQRLEQQLSRMLSVVHDSVSDANDSTPSAPPIPAETRRQPQQAQPTPVMPPPAPRPLVEVETKPSDRNKK